MLRDGDIVEIDADAGGGELLAPESIRNVTTGAIVGQKAEPAGRKVVGMIFVAAFALVLGFVVLIGIAALRTSQKVNDSTTEAETNLRCTNQQAEVRRLETIVQGEKRIQEMGGASAEDALRRAEQAERDLAAAKDALNACLSR